MIFGVCGLLIIFGGCKSKSIQTEEVKQEPVDTSSTVKTGEYFMETIFEQGITTGKETVIKLTPKISSDPNASVELQTLHDKKMHVIIVKNDLSLFYHIHPSQSANQEYTVPFTFNFGGDYVVFVDYAPKDAVQQLERKEINVAGKDYAKKEYATQRLSAEADGFSVKLIPDQNKIESDHAITFTSTILLNGKLIDANSLDNYLGAKAHMVIISEDTKQFLHVHPEIQGEQLTLHTEFPDSGMYRGWIQFQYKGKLHTVDFVFIVANGDGHEHDHNGEDEHEHNTESTHKH